MNAQRLGLLAHELRSPVAALVALADRAAAAELPAPVLTRMVRLAVAAGRDVERLLSDPDVLSLRLLPTTAGDVLGPLAQAGVTLRVEPVEIVCDATRLRQAVGNLVENGLRHGTAVSVDARRDGDRLVIVVADDGPGVAEGIDPFALGVSDAGSTGYGLWLARGVAEAHGGSLELCRDGAARGARFRLSLPLSVRVSG